MFEDVRYGLRLLLKNKGFTSVAVLSLALGIGANTALFSVLDAVMLKSLPVDHPEQLVLLHWLGGKGLYDGFRGSTDTDAATGLETSTSISYPAFERFRDDCRTLESVFAFAMLGRQNLNVDGQAEMAFVQAVSGSYFPALGVSTVVGRPLTAEDESTGAAPAAVISHGYWQRRFGGEQAALGKVLTLGGHAFTIVGVTPPEFFGTLDVDSAPDVTVTMGAMAHQSSGYARYQNSPRNWWLHIMARLRSGASATESEAELTTILGRHLMERPASGGEKVLAPRVRLTSGRQGLVEQRRRYSTQFAVLTGLVGLVLLIACVNLASLLMARAATRQKELALRASIGASRPRLIRQLLTESVLLAGLAGALGVLFAAWGKDALLALLMGADAQLAVAVGLDWRVLGFTTAISVLTGLLFGLAPALGATRVEPMPFLKESAGSSGRVRSRSTKTLIVAQVALSMLLLVGAGLFVRTLRNLDRIDAGFDRENLLMFSVNPRIEPARRENLYRQMTERIAALPDVGAVSSSQYPLLAGSYSSISIAVPGYTPLAGEEMTVRVVSVAPRFLTTMQIPLLLGRDVTAQDASAAPKVVVVNQALARRFFPEGSPIGRRLVLDGQDREIVGVSRDAKYGGIREEIVPVVYLPYLQDRDGVPAEMTFVVRSRVDPTTSVAAIRRAVQSIDRSVPLFDVHLQSDLIARSFSRARLFAALSSFFGLLALALVSIGLYGVMSYIVLRRTHEIGIRMAIGARALDVLRMVMGESLLLVFTGLAVGLAASLAAARLIAGLLFGLTPNDPLTYAMATLLLLSVALSAAWLPARRAARVDPLIALRHE